ncbi:MAG: OPT/YSL family transporter [Spirochaetes bacterium]|nr:OPT/YSL family transporter [Spirochaetota bacterium]
MDNETSASTPKKRHLSAFDGRSFVLGTMLAILAAMICMQLIGQVGVTPNTSLIGAIFAMAIARIPLQIMRGYRDLERQNLVQTITSSAGFAAANCGFIAIAIVFLMGRPDLIIPVCIGALIGCIISMFMLGRLFDSKIFPASGAWPPGVAVARTIEAGDEGGEKGKRLLQGIGVGVAGSIFAIPVAAIGIAFIANVYSMVGLGAGLVLRGYSEQIFGINLGATRIPQGFMVGAGLIALVQSLFIIFKKRVEKAEEHKHTVSERSAVITLVMSSGLHIGGAVVLALLTGVFSGMSAGQLAVWVLFAGVSSTIAMVLVGMAAMQSGWFPAFAIVTIFLTFGILLGIEPLALAVLVGYLCSVGPCFADNGYDLKAGWLLRGKGADQDYELDGRKQQIRISIFGAVIGIAVVMVFGMILLRENIMPPISHVFATAVMAGSDPGIVRTLLLWAIPGAIIQAAFGAKSVGVLFATGLLLNNPIYGIGVLIAVIIRLIVGNKFMEVRDAGLIAGDGLFGFFNNVFRALF